MGAAGKFPVDDDAGMVYSERETRGGDWDRDRGKARPGGFSILRGAVFSRLVTTHQPHGGVDIDGIETGFGCDLEGDSVRVMEGDVGESEVSSEVFPDRGGAGNMPVEAVIRIPAGIPLNEVQPCILHRQSCGRFDGDGAQFL